MSSIALPKNLNFGAILTPREDQIAEGIAKGRSKKEIPDLIAPTRKGTPVSVATVEHISKSVYRKTGAQKASEVTIWWFVRKYNIPVGVILFALFVTFEIYSDSEVLRTRSTRATECRTARSRRRADDNNDYILEA